MKAIILAAGRGSRLGQATRERPKCLVELCGRPLLSWQLDALRQGGVEELAVVTGYQSEVLEQAARPWSANFFHNPDWATTTMVHSLCAASPWLEAGPCLVSYSDIVYRPDIVRALSQCEAELCISCDLRWRSLWELRFDDPLEDAENCRLDEQGRLQAIGGRARSLDDIQAQYMGLLKFTPASWARFRAAIPAPDQPSLDMTALLSRLLEQGQPVQAVSIEGGWCEVDSQVDLDRYQKAIAENRFTHDWRGELSPQKNMQSVMIPGGNVDDSIR